MRDNALVGTILCEDNPIRPGTASRVRTPATQDGKLVVRPSVREAETLTVVVLVGVGVRGVAGLQVGAALLDGGVNVGLLVASRAAGVGALAGQEGVGDGSAD